MMSHPFEGWLVNSLGHAVGYRNFDTADQSRNNTWVAWYALGEGLQNNHHHNPGRANFAVAKGEVDLGYYICRALVAMGLLSWPELHATVGAATATTPVASAP